MLEEEEFFKDVKWVLKNMNGMRVVLCNVVDNIAEMGNRLADSIKPDYVLCWYISGDGDLVMTFVTDETSPIDAAAMASIYTGSGCARIASAIVRPPTSFNTLKHLYLFPDLKTTQPRT